MTRRGFSSMKPKTGNSDSLRLEEVVEFYKFADHPDEWIQIRFLDGDILPVKRHWIKIFAGKEKKIVTVPRICISFNPENESEPLHDKCPYDDLSSGDKDATVRNEYFYLVNGIIRDLQEEEPARKSPPTKKELSTGFKDIKSKSWTPVRILRLTNGIVARMQEIAETNIVKNKKTGAKKAFDVSHPRYGCDINIKYKPKKAGSEKYAADKVEGRTPISEEEAEYLVWDISPEILDIAGRMPVERALEDFKRLDLIDAEGVEDEDDEDDDDEYDLGSSRKKRRTKKKPSRTSAFDDDEDEDDDDDEDDSPPPRRGKKRRSSSSASSKRKRTSSSTTRRRKKPVEPDDDEDEDDVPPKRTRKRSSASSSARKRSSSSSSARKRSAKKAPSKPKRAAFDDDDDWDDDE